MSHPLVPRVCMFTQFLDTQVLQMLIRTLLTLRCSLHSQKGGPHSLTCHPHALWATELSFRCAHQTVHMLAESLLTSAQIPPSSKCGRHPHAYFFPICIADDPHAQGDSGENLPFWAWHVSLGQFLCTLRLNWNSPVPLSLPKLCFLTKCL